MTKLGNYQIDKIYNEDCYDAVKKLPNNSIDLIVMDPPYLIDQHGCGGCFGRERQKFHNEVATLSHGIDLAILDELVRVMKKINIYIFCNYIKKIGITYFNMFLLVQLIELNHQNQYHL